MQFADEWIPDPGITPGRIVNRSPVDVSWIVLHTVEGGALPNPGTARRIAERLAQPGVEVSTHYLTDCDEAVQQVDLADSAWAVGIASWPGLNQRSVSIEMCTTITEAEAVDWADDIHRRLLERTARLVRDLCGALAIPAERPSPDDAVRNLARGVIGHIDIADVAYPGERHDPGHAFPWDRFFALVTQTAIPEEIDMTPEQEAKLDKVLEIANYAGVPLYQRITWIQAAVVAAVAGTTPAAIADAVAAALGSKLPTTGGMTADQVRDAAREGVAAFFEAAVAAQA